MDITSVTNGTESGTQQVSTSITEDDTQPTVTLSRNNATIAEAAGVSTLTATLNHASTQDVTVTLTHTGTAGTGDRTVATSIVVSAGSLTNTTNITATQDTIYETNETVITDITGVTNGTESGTQTVTTTITDDDAQPSVTLSLDLSSIVEDGGVSTLTATLSNASYQNVTVNLTYTPTAGTDFTAAGSIVVNAGSLSNTTALTALTDSSSEGDETITVEVSSVTNGTESGTQTVTTTIIDDEGTITFANNILTYGSPTDLGTAIDPVGLNEVTDSYGVTKAAFQALNPQVVGFNGAPAPTQTLLTLIAYYAVGNTVTFTFPGPPCTTMAPMIRWAAGASRARSCRTPS